MQNSLVNTSLKELTVEIMRTKKKADYFATSVKRFYSVTSGGTSEERFGATGIIYLNYNDIKNLGMLIKAVAHETAHLLDDRVGVEDEIRDYLKNEFDRMYEGGI